MNNINIQMHPISDNNSVYTTFKCPINLQKKLEKIINDNKNLYSADEIITALLTYSLDTVDKYNYFNELDYKNGRVLIIGNAK